MRHRAFARALVAGVLALGASSCVYDSPLRQVAFSVAFAGVERDVTQPFVVQAQGGWTVTLTAAQVSIGPVYFYNGQAGVGTDQDDGRVVAQVLARFTVDALNPYPGVVTGAGSAITEAARTAEVRLVELSDGPVWEASGRPRTPNAVAHVAGVAQRGDVAIPFDGTLRVRMDPTGMGYQTWVDHQVVHIPVDFTAEDGGTLTLRVDPTHWFETVAFDAASGQPPDFTSDPARRVLRAGVGSSTGVFAFTWTPPRGER